MLRAAALVAFAATAFAAYDQSIAQQFAYLSSIAYCPGDKIASWSCGTPCENHPVQNVTVQYNKPRNVLSYVGMMPSGDALVVFRGTEPFSLTDWIKDDLEFAKLTPADLLNCSGCRVHEGFYDSYTDLRPGILSALQALGVRAGSNVYVTGHSLGAAMASLCIFDLHQQGFNVLQSYTFGQPRVGDDAYYAAFKSQIGVAAEYRVVHACDPVPTLPFEWMGFHHVPTEVWYDESQDNFAVCDGSGEDSACDGCLLPLNVLDHLNYVKVPMGTLCGIPVNATMPSALLHSTAAAIVHERLQ